MGFYFINNGTDARILKSLSVDNPSEDLVKAMNKQGLVQKEVQVRGKHGIHTRKQWVKAGESTHNQNSKRTENNNRRDSKIEISKQWSDKNTLFLNNATRNQEYLDTLIKTYKNDSSLQKKYGNFKNYVKSNYFISDGNNTTADAYRLSPGRWKPERFKTVHEPIIKKFLEDSDTPPEGKKPVCFLYGGGSGSGKSTVVNAIATPVIESTGLKFCKVDCDSIKAMLPEHNMFLEQNKLTTAFREHRESSDIANEAIDQLIKNGKCFQYDGTMSDFNKYKKLIGKLKENGYEVHIVATDIPVDEAIRRAAGRERQIPNEVVEKTHREFGENFLEIASLEVDSWCLYDNTQPMGEPNRCIVIKPKED